MVAKAVLRSSFLVITFSLYGYLKLFNSDKSLG